MKDNMVKKEKVDNMVKKEKVELELSKKNIKYLQKLIREGMFLTLSDAINLAIYNMIVIDKTCKKLLNKRKELIDKEGSPFLI